MRTQVGIGGMCSWDHLINSERYPVPASIAVVERQIEQPGGTAANTCVALAKLGHPPLFSTCVGNDAQGQAIIQVIHQLHKEEAENALVFDYDQKKKS